MPPTKSIKNDFKKQKNLQIELNIVFIPAQTTLPHKSTVEYPSCLCLCHESQVFEDTEYPCAFFESKKGYFKNRQLLFEISKSEIWKSLINYNQTDSESKMDYFELLKSFLHRTSISRLTCDKNEAQRQVLDPKNESTALTMDAFTGLALSKRYWTIEEDTMLRYLKIAHWKLDWNGLAGLLGKQTAQEVKERWEDTVLPCLKLEDWTPREKWFFYLFKRNLGPNWLQIRRIFRFNTENQLIYLWNREIVQKRAEYENLIWNLLKNPDILFSDTLTDLERFLIRKPRAEELQCYKLDGVYLRKRKRKNWVPANLEELFSCESLLLKGLRLVNFRQTGNLGEELAEGCNFTPNLNRIQSIIFSPQNVDLGTVLKEVEKMNSRKSISDTDDN